MEDEKTILQGNWKKWLKDIPAYSQEEILEQRGYLQYNENAFELGRHCWVDKTFLKLSLQNKKWVVKYWYVINEYIIRDSVERDFTSSYPSEEEVEQFLSEYNFEDFWIDFMASKEKVITYNFSAIIKQALLKPLPKEALTEEMVDCPILQKILSVCHFISNQKLSCQGTFRISTQQAGQIVNQDSIRGGACLRALGVLGKIKRLELGTPGGKSSLYQYLYQS